tara:strand:+ start:270 stop:953 length:684 start_codon:yes stop_codon:yes gene_type:complete
MPAKKKTKTKKKKATSSSFGELYVDVIKNRDNSPSQKKINKLMMKPNASNADRNFLAMMLADGSKQWKFDLPATVQSPYRIARGIKNYRELQGFVERFAGGMHEAEIARLVLDNVQTKKGFNRWRILENDNLPYVWTLLSAIDKDPKQAVGVYDIYKKNPKNEVKNPLRKFEVRTSYVVPTSIKAFQSDISGWKKLLNVGRSGNYRTGKGSSSRENQKWNSPLKPKN